LRPLRDLVAQSKLVEFEAFEALHHSWISASSRFRSARRQRR